MEVLKGNCIIGQSGGPTSVINASVYGVIHAALENEAIPRVLGAEHGIRGVLDDCLIDLGKEDPAELARLPYTPSSALGSVRYKLKNPEEDETDYLRILEIFKKYDVRYFFYAGGNDSMDTCAKISRYMKTVGYECRVIGVPKTIDNDLYGIDHCPGFGSAAKYIATTFMEVYLDARVYDTGTITVIECMGRHAGWLTAASALAGLKGCGPDLIYLPETDFDLERFLSDVQNVYRKTGYCIVAVSEGVHYADGRFVSEGALSETDSFGHAQLGGLAAQLAEFLQKKTGAKVRGIELSLLQRCASHVASATDIQETFALGATAVAAAVQGNTGKMVSLSRVPGETYQVVPEMLDLDLVANYEKKIPTEWITPEKNGVTEDFIHYCLPLIAGETAQEKEDGLPRFARLKKIKA